ncbi:MAG: DUF5659 domain-containing protein [Acidobacteriota bacterium]
MREQAMVNSFQQPCELFETSDLNLASFLRCRDFHVLSLQRENERVLFAFEDSPLLKQAILDFVNDGAVGVRSFCNTLRDLKALIRGAGRRSKAAAEENGL